MNLSPDQNKAEGNWDYINIDVLLDAAEYLERFVTQLRREVDEANGNWAYIDLDEVHDVAEYLKREVVTTLK